MSQLKPHIALNYIVSKSSGTPQDCQDAFDINVRQGLFAIADGVTRSFFPSEWSSLLVKHFCQVDLEELESKLFNQASWTAWLEPIQKQWYQEISTIINDPQIAFDIRNRYREREPAASTFVGLQLLKKDSSFWTNWRAIIVGDSVLLHIRQGRIHKSYSITHSSDFNNYPENFASYPNKSNSPKYFEDVLEANDSFILTTDALAKWLLKQNEVSFETWQRAWETLQRIKDWDEFYQFVHRQRNDRQNLLEDDDVAIVLVSVEPLNTVDETSTARYFSRSTQQPRPTVEKPPKEPVVKPMDLSPIVKNIEHNSKKLKDLQEASTELRHTVLQNQRALPVIMILIIFSILLGIVNLLFNLQQSNTSSLLVESINKLEQLTITREISTSTPTILPTVTPTVLPTSTPTIVPTPSTVSEAIDEFSEDKLIVLNTGERIFSETLLNISPIAIITQPIDAILLDNPIIDNEGNEWQKISLDAWLILNPEELSLDNDSSSLFTFVESTAYSRPIKDEKFIIGHLMPNNGFLVKGSIKDDDNQEWDKVQLIGFISLTSNE